MQDVRSGMGRCQLLRAAFLLSDERETALTALFLGYFFTLD